MERWNLSDWRLAAGYLFVGFIWIFAGNALARRQWGDQALPQAEYGVLRFFVATALLWPVVGPILLLMGLVALALRGKQEAA